jgi:hypothetical protein
MIRGVIFQMLAAGACASLMAGAAAAEPARFDSPDAAVAALIGALEARDRPGVLAVFGPEAEDVISTGSPDRDRAVWTDFLEGWRELNRIAVDAAGDVATLHIGRDQWPFPIALRRGADGWAFDAEGGREEIRLRRIGRNELDVIELLRAYVRVQSDYRRTDWDGDGVMEFASGVLSTPGARDGLYWPAEPGAPESPVGDFVARASADGYTMGDTAVSAEPYLGYVYRVLLGQTDAAPGGALAYRVNGNMVAGHALLAFPAEYGETGVMSFMIAEGGVIHEADLGPETLEAAARIERFDPGPEWRVAE